MLDIDTDIDLTGLDKAAVPKGKPIPIPIDDLIEDPNQPRQDFDEGELKKLAANIKAKGVKTPISVKPKNAAGKYVINHGARRYRASRLAGKTTVPAFIDENHDKYDQVAENLLRDDLTPMELALFIHERVEAGDKKGEIAQRLGQESQSFISEHLPLIKAPASIQALARTKKFGSKTLYVLCKAHQKKPQEIEAYIASTEEITRPGIHAILRGTPAADADPAETLDDAQEDAQQPASDAIAAGAPAADAGPTEAPGEAQEDAQQPASDAIAAATTHTPPVAQPQPSAPIVEPTPAPTPGPAGEASPKPGKPAAAPAGRQLSIEVRIGGRLARVQQAGKITVTFEGSSETAEIDFAAAEIVGTKSV